ncbi:MAG: NAD(P)H-dependent oxidoreductase [Silvanigrellales bacterium]|jgi:NAD(P)H-dependent FMN reductase|nr:NAD(P)H-dependent oxidoreductase [Silvanigrellales bacterium]
MKVVLVCASLKPSPGEWWSSAAREYLSLVQKGALCAQAECVAVDVRETPDLLEASSAPLWNQTLHDANGIVVSLPCYWGSLSAPSLRVIEAVSRHAAPLVPVGGLFLGMDLGSAQSGRRQTERALGAHRLLPVSVEVSNPRDLVTPGDAAALRRSLLVLGMSTAVLARTLGLGRAGIPPQHEVKARSQG